MQPDATRIANITAAVGAGIEVEEMAVLGVMVHAPLESLAATLEALKDGEFGFLVDMFASDTGERIEVTYHLRSLARDEEVFVRSALSYDGTLPSMWALYPAVAFPEREAAELCGFKLSGHPHPRRLLTTAGCPPYLRKDVPVRGAEEVRLR